MPRLTISPFGAQLRIEASDRRVLDAANAALGRYPSDGGVQLQLRLCVDAIGDDGESAWPVTSRLDGGTEMELRCGGSTLRCDHSTGIARLSVTPATLATADELRMFVEAAFWSPVISSGLVHAVHSALVVRHGVGLLLRGESGAGKSTLSYAALEAGFQLVSDDWVYAPAAASPDVLWGYPWRMWMTTDAATRFPSLSSRSAVPHPGSDRVKILVEPPIARRRVRHRVDAVVMIEPSEQVAVESMPGTEAAHRFDRSALDSERGSLPAEFVAALLDRPCFVLRRGASPATAAAVLDDLCATLRRARQLK